MTSLWGDIRLKPLVRPTEIHLRGAAYTIFYSALVTQILNLSHVNEPKMVLVTQGTDVNDRLLIRAVVGMVRW
jgi:hypothetical protein